jgi:hypothetical protein
MAFLKTSDSIIIRATLTEKGRKLMSRGKFKIAKFALGDDEIDYSLYDSSMHADASYRPALLNTFSLEAYGDRLKNIQYGLNSYDVGVIYLKDSEIEAMEPEIHASIYWMPTLVKNDLLSMSPTWRDSTYYVSVNDETTSKIREGIPNFKFLEDNNLENCKIIIESGIIGQNPGAGGPALPTPTFKNRIDYILKKFLLDHDFFINVDDRFIRKLAAISPKSKFQSFPSGEYIADFETLNEIAPISLENQFPNYASYVAKGVNNMVADSEFGATDATRSAGRISALDGPRGSVFALNVMVDEQIKANSTGERDFRYKKFGEINQIVFSEMATSKFDYIDTTIYIYGGTTNSRIVVPVRLIRYAGI